MDRLCCIYESTYLLIRIVYIRYNTYTITDYIIMPPTFDCFKYQSGIESESARNFVLSDAPDVSESESEQKERAEKRKAAKEASKAEFHEQQQREMKEFAKSEVGVFMREQHAFRAEQKAREDTLRARMRRQHGSNISKQSFW